MQPCLSTVGKHNCISASSSYWIVCYMKLWSLEENLGLFTDLLSSLHLTGQCPHKSILLPAQIPLRKYCVIDPWASVPLRLKTEEYIVHFTGAVSCKIRIAVVIQTLGKKSATRDDVWHNDDARSSVWVSCQSPEWSEINHSQGCQLASARRHLSLNPCQ